MLPLLPAWPYSQKPMVTPAWFTTGARSLPVGEAVLVYPIADPSDASAMVWQTFAHMTFRMPGGYAVFAGPGKASFTSPSSVTQEALGSCRAGQTLPISASQVRADLADWRAQEVAVVLSAPGAPCAANDFDHALGQGRRTGGVLLWRVGK